MLRELGIFGAKPNSSLTDRIIGWGARAALAVRGRDIPVSIAVEASAARATELAPVDLLESLRSKYEGARNRPEFSTALFQEQLWGDIMATLKAIEGPQSDLDTAVPPLDWSAEAIKRPMVDVRGKEVDKIMVYKPAQFLGQNGFARLQGIWDKVRSSWVEDISLVVDPTDTAGWVGVEATLDAPNAMTISDDLVAHTEKTGYGIQKGATYILFAVAFYGLTGHYPDEQTVYRFPIGKKVAYALFGSGGDLLVGRNLDPRLRYSGVGGRFEEVNKT